MGAGFTFCRAIRVFMLEPSWVMRDTRLGRSAGANVVLVNRRTFSYRFIMEGLAVEQKIKSMQMARGGS